MLQQFVSSWLEVDRPDAFKNTLLLCLSFYYFYYLQRFSQFEGESSEVMSFPERSGTTKPFLRL